ncbi:MAG: C39 family peptidase, partial [Candidatus Kerfeldbacteria bacterium]|nr:C39 family peptidase [Candidatus Kerfeldbacteria bacterium]
MKRIYWIIGIGIIVVGMITGVVGWQQRVLIKDWVAARRTPAVPVAVTYEGIAESQKTLNKNEELGITENTEEASEDTEKTIVIPKELNLAIPFTSQAPFANWDAVHEETCEEASILMAGRFLLGRGIADAQDAETAMLEIVASEENDFGYGVSISAEHTVEVLVSIYPSLDAEVVFDFSWDDVKTALAQGYPVIAPAAGRELGNPNFTAPGPLYHMLVIKGYTDQIVITNDPGTRKGADYTYSYDTLY